MSKYTIELRNLLNSNFVLFDFEYSFLDDENKKKLEDAFIKHFYFKEIGFETPARFKHYVNIVFTEKLPYYEMLLKTSLIEYDIKNNYDMTENLTKDTSNSINSETTTELTNTESLSNSINSETTTELTNTESLSSSSIQKASDTPQSSVNLSDNYYSNIEESNNSNNSTSNNNSTSSTSNNNSTSSTSNNNSTSSTSNTGTGKESYILTRKGNIGVMTASDLIEKHIELQQKLTNIINQFLENECNDLFMKIY